MLAIFGMAVVGCWSKGVGIYDNLICLFGQILVGVNWLMQADDCDEF